MAKVKTKVTGDKISLWIRSSFGERLDFSEYAHVYSNGHFGLLKPESIKGSSIYYEVFTGKTLRRFLTTELSRNDIVSIIEQILLVMLEIEELGLSKESVLMDMNSIFMDTSCNEIRMVCSGSAAIGKNHNISNLLYEILNAYTPKETSNLNFRRRFLDFLDKLEDADIYRIENYLVGEKKKVVLEVRDKYYTSLYSKLAEKHDELQRVGTIKKSITQEKEKLGSEKDDDEYVDDDEPTGFAETDDDAQTGFAETEEDEPTGFYDSGHENLDDSFEEDIKEKQNELNQPNIFTEKKQNNNCVSLFRKSNGETVYINQVQFRLGREEGSVDYCISDDMKISRAHADIILRGNQWYVVDLKSKNRTFLNDRVLSANIETPLQDGDVIKLNNEEFVFCLKS